MKTICKKEHCTACFACINACPKNCITMKQDDDLCHRPAINEDICIHCNKCISVCPNNNPPEFKAPEKVIAAYSQNEDIHKTSTSGGVAAEIAHMFVENGGAVYGAAVGNDFTVNHIRCKSTDDLKLISSSKYVHSHINDTYSKAKSDLDKGINVLFTGTGCQIAGLLNFLDRDYDNLFTIDIICHGTPDREIFIQYSKAILKDEAESFSFRDGNEYTLRYYNANGDIIAEEKEKSSPYLSNFIKGYSLRPACHKCMYARCERVSDITLGDFWKLGDDKNFIKSKSGNNLVLINTKKGFSLFEKISDRLIISERDIDEAINGNKQLSAPNPTTPYSIKFNEICKSSGNCVKAMKECNRKNYIIVRLRRLENIIPPPIFRLLKKLLKK